MYCKVVKPVGGLLASCMAHGKWQICYVEGEWAGPPSMGKLWVYEVPDDTVRKDVLKRRCVEWKNNENELWECEVEGVTMPRQRMMISPSRLWENYWKADPDSDFPFLVGRTVRWADRVKLIRRIG